MSRPDVDWNALAQEAARILAGPPAEARAWLTPLAERGIAQAQVRLGQLLLDEAAGPPDPAGALAWFLKAAGQDDPLAFNMVGRCYENGWGAPENIVVAAQWYRQAAELGSDWGMYNHATRLMLGDAVGIDRAGALTWFRKAAELGHAKSINIVGGFYEDGWEVEQDFAQARDHYRRAAEAGDFRGQFNFGRVLASEGAVNAALEQFAKAAVAATPAFIDKMVAFLSAAPIVAYRELADRLRRGKGPRP